MTPNWGVEHTEREAAVGQSHIFVSSIGKEEQTLENSTFFSITYLYYSTLMNADPRGLKQSYSAGSTEGAGLQKKRQDCMGD